VERTKGAVLLSNLIEPMFALGQWAQAEELLDRALELDPPAGFRAHLQRLKLWSTLWGGDPERAEQLLRSWHASLHLQAQNEAQVRLGLARVAGEIALENGDIADAWQQVRGILDPGHRALAAYDLPLLMVAARVLAATTGPHTAELMVLDAPDTEQLIRTRLSRYANWPGHRAYAAVVDAELGRSSQPGTDVALWRAALQAAATPTTPAFLRPWIRVRLAEALATAGDRTTARQEAEAARGDAGAIGAGLIVDRAAALEQRMGARVTTAHADGSLAMLTDRERQVLELVAQGMSNRQIAESLFISVKTASVHVSAILRKLGAASRTEAAHFARRAE
jgi:DNA-binding NarL/FixJ family response regulator